jgi:hypothetical protein
MSLNSGNWSFGVKQQSLTLQDTIKKSTYLICDQTLCLYILALSNNNTHNFPVLVTLIFTKGRRGRDHMGNNCPWVEMSLNSDTFS